MVEVARPAQPSRRSLKSKVTPPVKSSSFMFRLHASPLTWCTSSPASAVGNSTSGKLSRHYTSAWTAIDRTSRRRPKKSRWRLIFAQTATPWAISVWLWLINSTRQTPCFERTGSRAGFDSCKRRRPKALTSGFTDFETPQPWLLLAISAC